jgi:DNA-binding beta-propeller fold protein YncE
VANQSRNGVSVIDPIAMREVTFIPSGAGAHGLAVSRDTNVLYVSNRVAGTISVLDFATKAIVGTWTTSGSPDMMQVSPDGSQLWASGRFNGEVYVVDTRSSQVLQRIAVAHDGRTIARGGKGDLGAMDVDRAAPSLRQRARRPAVIGMDVRQQDRHRASALPEQACRRAADR